jgi:hypothetical protein
MVQHVRSERRSDGTELPVDELGLSDKLQHVWKDARLEFEVNVVRANKSDDRFVEPGLEFPVGGAPSNPATALIKPDPEPDVANYLIRGGYEKKISARWFWNAGGSWYRNGRCRHPE